MALIDLSVRKTRSVLKLITTATLFVVGFIALLVGGTPRHTPAGEQGIFPGAGVAHADVPYSQGSYYAQSEYGGDSSFSCDSGCGSGDGSGDGGSSC